MRDESNNGACNLSELELTKSTQLDALVQVMDAIHRGDDIIAILAMATEQIFRSINCDFVNVLFHNPSAKHFYLHRCLSPQNSAADDLIIIPYHETSITDIVRSHRSVIREDLSQRGNMTPGDLRFIAQDIKSDLSVPIISNNQVQAILHLSSYQAHFFTEQSEYQAEQFAKLIALAFERTDLIERLNRHQSNFLLWKNKFNRLFENISQPVVLVRSDDDLICACNLPFQQVSGYTAEQLNGMRLSSLHPEHGETILSRLDKFSPQVACSELGVLKLVRSDGQQVLTKVRLVAVAGNQRRFVLAIYDPLFNNGPIRRQRNGMLGNESSEGTLLLSSFGKLIMLSEQSLSLDQLIQSALLILKTDVTFDYAQICLFSSDKPTLETYTMISEACRQLSNHADWMIVEAGEFYWYNVAHQPRSAEPSEVIVPKLRSKVAAALERGTRVLGTLLVGSLKPEQYHEEQVEIVNQLAGPIAWLIDNAQSAPENDKQKRIEQAKSKLDSLVSQDDGIEQHLRALAKLSADLLDAKLASIHFIESQFAIPDVILSDAQCCSAAIASFERKCVFPRTLAKSEWYVIETIPNETLDCSDVLTPDYVSYLSIPLKSKGKTIAILTNYSNKLYLDSSDTTLNIAVISSVAGDVLRQLRFDQQIAQRLDHLERAVEWAADTIDNFANDLRAPVSSIQALVTAALEHLEQRDAPQISNYLQLIKTRSRYLQLYIDALAKFADFDLAVPRQSLTSTQELIAEVIQRFQQTIEQRKIKLKIDQELPAIRGDRQLMFQLFSQLIDCTIEQLTDREVRPSIEITYKSGRGEGFFVIRNNGPVIQNGQLHNFFESPNLGEDHPNNGIQHRLSLAIAKKIVELHNGQIWFESAATHGNRFYLRLPVAS